MKPHKLQLIAAMVAALIGSSVVAQTKRRENFGLRVPDRLVRLAS